jgi:hypothetical protein
MNKKKIVIGLILSCVLILSSSMVAAGKVPPAAPTLTLLAAGLEGASGSTIGPDGALYVTEGAAGRVSRVDPQTGEITPYASGLPPWLVGLGGAIDVAFIGNTAYVLVTMVGPDLGGNDVVGIYRVDGPGSFTVIADIGDFSIRNPSQSVVVVPSGVQYAMEVYRGGFLVTDGHHNRVLWVRPDGSITEMMAFGNIVPTGLEVRGYKVYMAEAGPNPHLPQDGKVVAFGPKSPNAVEVASGAPLLTDVEFGRGYKLYALSQGIFEEGQPDGAPAMPNTGSLVAVNSDGSFSSIVEGLNQPTSLEFIGNNAYVVTHGGEIWRIANVSAPPFSIKR